MNDFWNPPETVKTGKPHECACCGGKIEAGTDGALNESGRYHGEFWKRYACPRCAPYVGEFWGAMGQDEETSLPEDFIGYIRDAHPEVRINEEDDE